MFGPSMCTGENITINTDGRTIYFKVFCYSLREHLRTHETFTVDQILRDFLHNRH